MKQVKDWVIAIIEDDTNQLNAIKEKEMMASAYKMASYDFNDFSNLISSTDDFIKQNGETIRLSKSIEANSKILSQIELLDELDAILTFDAVAMTSLEELDIQHINEAKSFLNEVKVAAIHAANAEYSDYEYIETLFEVTAPLTHGLKMLKENNSVHWLTRAINGTHLMAVSKLIQINNRLDRFRFYINSRMMDELWFVHKDEDSYDEYKLTQAGHMVIFESGFVGHSLKIEMNAQYFLKKENEAIIEGTILLAIGTIGYLQNKHGEVTHNELKEIKQKLLSYELITKVEITELNQLKVA